MADHSIRTVSQKLRLLEKWDDLCIVCGLPIDDLLCFTVEHIVPITKCLTIGVSQNSENVAPAHSKCNMLKGEGSLIKAMQKRQAHAVVAHEPMKQKLRQRAIKAEIINPKVLRPFLVDSRAGEINKFLAYEIVDLLFKVKSENLSLPRIAEILLNNLGKKIHLFHKNLKSHKTFSKIEREILQKDFELYKFTLKEFTR